MEQEAGARPDADDDIRRDSRDLQRGFVINLGGYVFKIAYAGLLVATIRLYGAERFGIFSVVQAAIYLATRTCTIGLDKGILWWVNQPEARGRAWAGVRPVATIAWITSSIVAVILALAGGPFIARWAGSEVAADQVRWMAFGLVPMTLMEILIHAALGRRRLEAQVIVREGLASLTLVVAAVAYYYAGLAEQGLALAFLTSTLAGLCGAIWVFRRAYRGEAIRGEGRGLRPPPALLRYATPMWLSDVLTSLLLRMDVYLLAALSEPKTVGIYSACVQLGNSIRQVRRSFDPMVLAIVAEIGVTRDRRRLAAGLSQATVLVMAIQGLIFAFMVAFADWLLPFLGEGFAEATAAVLILCTFWLVDGVLGLHGIIVAGYGRTELSLVNVLATIGALSILMPALVPSMGLEGAALAVGLAYALQNSMQLIESRLITGTWGYTREVLWLMLVAATGGTIMAMTWLGLLPLGDVATRIGSFLAFLVVAAPGVAWLHRSGRLGIYKRAR
ncbi:MAG: lipopolysaccharide biosynthesis protein [Nannocystaceae bacterium]